MSEISELFSGATTERIPTDKIHARMLLKTIESVDLLIERAIEIGCVPLVDAVELSKLLKALVGGHRRYIPSIEAAKARASRARVASSVSVLPIAWTPSSEGDER